MNPVEEKLLPPPQAPQPHRISTSCDRHPDENFTGFCPSCLCERLAVLDQSSSAAAAATTAGRKSASSAIKSLFRGSAAANGNGPGERQTFRTRPGSFLPELRRTKSFSGGKNDVALALTGIFEPQRKSCDVRVRSTLSSLFNHDHGKRAVATNSTNEAAASSSRFGPVSGADQVEGKFNNSDGIVIDLKKQEESEQEVVLEGEEEEEEKEERGVGVERVQGEQANSGEIEEIEEPIASGNSFSNPNLCSEEQLGEKLEGGKMDLKPMKYHIDLDSHNKKAGGKDLKDLAGSFWSAASGFSKKLRSWTRKNNKLKKHSVQVSKKSNAARSCRETQSEIADYGYGRRSCDTDPRFSIDAGRMSLDYGRMSLDYGRMSVDAGRMSLDAGRFSADDPRYSFDEPRASWDGYLIGGGGRPTTLTRMNPMVSVVEDPAAPARPPSVMVLREDNRIPLEEPRKSVNEEEGMPGGAVQTKDYYLDSSSSSRRRKSLDRSNSIRKTADAVVAEMDEMKSVACNAKVTPTSVDYLHSASTKGTLGIGGDRELRDSNPSSLLDDCSESFDMGFRDSASVIGGNGDRKGAKKSRSWRSWNIWGLIVRRGSNKDEDDDRYSRVNGVERSYSESWQDQGRDGYGRDPRGGAFSRNVLRSNSSVSWRNSYSVGGPLGGSMRKNSAETNGHAKKKSNEFVLERNRSARYSPSHADNGLLRFYLTPMRGSRRGVTGKAKPAAYSHTIARSMLRLY